MKEIFIEIKKLVDKSDKILLTSHLEPDGDALGSMLALKICFENIGKKTDILCTSGIPDSFRFLPHVEEMNIKIETSYDLIFGLDYGDLKRLESVAADLPLSLPAVTFDHHPFLNQAGELKVIDPSFSSTCEIIYHFLSVNNLEIDRKIATCLLTGIFADTWSFRHPNTTAQTLKIVGELLAKGAALGKIIKLNNQNDILIKSKLWGSGLTKINLDKESGMVFCFFSFDDLTKYSASHRDLSGLSSFISTVPEAKFSLVLSEFAPGCLDGSLRALPGKGIDVSKIAQIFGGGGHKLSAGFKTQGRPEEVIIKIKDLIKAY